MATGAGDGFSSRRVALVAAALVGVGAVAELAVRRSLAGAVSLTVAGAVSIINFRWLEQLVLRVAQPGRPHIDGGAVLRFLVRVLLVAAAVAALMWVPRVDFAAVALGVSALVVSLIVEGLRWGREGGG